MNSGKAVNLCLSLPSNDFSAMGKLSTTSKLKYEKKKVAEWKTAPMTQCSVINVRGTFERCVSEAIKQLVKQSYYVRLTAFANLICRL